jgi:hypothetical protein
MRRHGGGLPIERFAALRRAKDIIGQAALAWIQHGASTMGAALAFYTVFSVAPILIIAIGVLDLFVGTDTVKAELMPQTQILFGDAGASAVQALLLSATLMGNSHVATFVGVATLLIGASSVFVELQNSLDRILGCAGAQQNERVLAIRPGPIPFARPGFRSGIFTDGVALGQHHARGIGCLDRFVPRGVAHLAAGRRCDIELEHHHGSFCLCLQGPQAKMEWIDIWVGGDSQGAESLVRATAHRRCGDAGL